MREFREYVRPRSICPRGFESRSPSIYRRSIQRGEQFGTRLANAAAGQGHSLIYTMCHAAGCRISVLSPTAPTRSDILSARALTAVTHWTCSAKHQNARWHLSPRTASSAAALVCRASSLSTERNLVRTTGRSEGSADELADSGFPRTIQARNRRRRSVRRMRTLCAARGRRCRHERRGSRCPSSTENRSAASSRAVTADRKYGAHHPRCRDRACLRARKGRCAS